TPATKVAVRQTSTTARRRERRGTGESPMVSDPCYGEPEVQPGRPRPAGTPCRCDPRRATPTVTCGPPPRSPIPPAGGAGAAEAVVGARRGRPQCEPSPPCLSSAFLAAPGPRGRFDFRWLGGEGGGG